MKSFKTWNDIFRLETIPLSVLCIAIGTSLARYYGGNIDWKVCIFAFCTSAFLQVGCNVANDYGDFVSGADELNKVKPSSAIQLKKVSIKECKIIIVLFSALSTIFGIVTLVFARLSFLDLCVFLCLGFLSIVASIKYTLGKNPYGYRRLGDICVIVFFGVVGVCGSFYLQTQVWKWVSLVLAIGYGSIVAGVLNINNIRDIEADRLASKHTVASWIGRDNAILFQYFLISLNCVTCVWYTIYLFGKIWVLVYIPSFFLFYSLANKLKKARSVEMTNILKLHVFGIILFSITIIGSFRILSRKIKKNSLQYYPNFSIYQKHYFGWGF